jgi:CRISPR-associated protein Csb2
MYLRITIRFLDGRYHGHGDGGVSEWPPSPWRLFQALLAGAKTDWSEARADGFKWLEELGAPTVHTANVPRPVASSGVLTYVPGNTADHGRMPKLIQPRVLPANGRHVAYVWKAGDDPTSRSNADAMAAAARHIRCVGWGIDMAIGHGELLAELPAPGEKQIALNPSGQGDFGGELLRIPCAGSLASLEEAHNVAMKRLRITDSGVVEVHDQPGLARFEVQSYGPAVTRSFCAFDLCRSDDSESDEHTSFDPRQIKAVVGMVRGLLGSDAVRAKLGHERVDTMLLGHPKEYQGPRVSILPLPSVGNRNADGRVRRLVLAEPASSDGAVSQQLAELLNGRTLKPELESAPPVARLVRLPGDAAYLRRYYVGSSQSWATVSPVLLPGFDGRTDRRRAGRRLPGTQQLDRAEQLVRKSLTHAGVTATCKIELSPVSWWAGVPSATAFVPRDKLGPCPRYHVKLTFDQPFAGPLSLGRQRHAGLGVFAALDDCKE